MYASAQSCTVALFGMLIVLEIAPEMNGCAAAIIRTWPIGLSARAPIAVSKTS